MAKKKEISNSRMFVLRAKFKKAMKNKGKTIFQRRKLLLCDGRGSVIMRPVIKLSEAWNTMRKENILCDGVVYSNDEHFYPVHGWVLSLLGSYFKRLFQNPKMAKRSDRNEVKVPVPAAILENILDFAYTGTCNISNDNVKTLLHVAYYYGINSLATKCCEYLYENMRPDTCIATLRQVRPFLCSEWQRKVMRYICHRFKDIMNMSAEFTGMRLEEMQKVLQDDELNVDNENTVFEAIVKWVQKYSRRRKKYLPFLIHCPRYGCMTTQYYKDTVLQHHYIKNNLELQEMLRSATLLLEENESTNDKTIDIDHPLTRPRIPYEILFVIGGWSFGKPTNAIETYDSKANMWYVSDHADEKPIAYHAACVLDNLIYIIGGFDGRRHRNNLRCYDPVTHKWSELAAMYYKRCYVSACVLDGTIYALGGYNGHLRLPHAEVYDPKINQWKRISDMRTRRSDASAASLGGKVYIAGGYNGHQILRSVESYDRVTLQWEFITQHMDRVRCGLSLIAHNNNLYAIGGSNGLSRLKNGEWFNGIGWQPMSEMKTPRSNASAAVVDGVIYVIGGYNGRKTVDSVECYDPCLNKWYELKESHLRRSAAAACVVSGLSNAKEYSYHRNESS